MRKPGKGKISLALFWAIWIGALALTSALPASATLVASKSSDCREGEYVVGLAGRTGAWIDAIAPVCARWDDRRFQPVAPHKGIFIGGRGGGANEQLCPAGSAVSAWKVGWVRAEGGAFAQTVTAECGTLAPPHETTSTDVRLSGAADLPPGLRKPQRQSCPTGQLATGVAAWLNLDGRFVTDVKMTCRAAPFVESTMTWQAGANGSVTYFSPTLKLSSGDGVRLDWCREWANNCGQPAADAFCKARGKIKAARFAPHPNVGLTMIISDKKICNAPGCSGFESIECSAVP